MRNKNFWTEFWQNYTHNLKEMDEQSQVLRTYNKKPISEELWNYTLNKIDETFIVKKNEKILDLCSGNGLLAKHFVSKGATVVAVDISDKLLRNISDIEGIEPINLDIRLLDFKKHSFDNIVIYAGIQYLNYKETVLLLKKIFMWLKPGGKVYIGDIPDLRKRWFFFNTVERQKVYFENLLADKAIVGTWFENEWFNHLTNYLGFSEGKYVPQDNKLIYSDFRFDFLYTK